MSNKIIEEDEFMTTHVTSESTECMAFQCVNRATIESRYKDPLCWRVNFWCAEHGLLPK